MKLKKVISFVLAGMMTLGLLTGCGGSTTDVADETPDNGSEAVSDEAVSDEAVSDKAGKAIELAFWNPFTGSDGAVMNQMVEDFNQANEGKINVTVQTMESTDYYAKIPTVFASGTGIPDVVILHIDRIPYYSQKGMIEPMDDAIASMGLSKDDFIASTWDAGVMSDGQRYSLPLDTHMWEVFYNKDILAEIGYSEEDLENVDKEKFMEICQAAVDKGYVGFGLYWPGICNLFYGLLNQFGGSYVDPVNPTTPLFNSDAGVQAADFIKEMKDAGLTNEIGADQESLFKAGTALFCSTGIWANNGFREIEGLNYGQMFCPEIGGTAGNMASSHNLVIMNQPEEDTARYEACVEFIKYLSDNSLTWAGAGQVPVRLDILQSDGFKELPWAFAAENLDAFTYLPACMTAANMDSAVNEHLQEYYNGNYATAKEALTAAETQARQLAEETMAAQ